MRSLLAIAALLIAGCATAPPTPPSPLERPEQEPRWSAAETLALVERDVAAGLGEAALDEARRAPTSVLVRHPIAFPRITRLPDGSWQREPPQVATAVKTAQGWIARRDDGRFSLDPYAARELDRLLARRELWDEPELAEHGCTDPAGISSVVRHRGRIRVATQPCGASGLTGRIGAIVLAGRITDWSQVPPDGRPDGIPMRRFHDSVAQYFNFATGIYEPRNLAIRTPAEWEGMWRRITASHGDPPPPPEVPFDRDMLLLAAMGPQPSGGFRIRIERVLDGGAELEAHVVHVSPGARCGAIAAITHPIDIVIIAASPKPVRWLVRHEIADCA